MYQLTLPELIALSKKTYPELSRLLPAESLTQGPGGKTYIAPKTVRDILEGEGVDYSYRTFSLINLRGGVAKTTSTIHLATRAAQFGFRVCIVDLDPQGSASLAFDCLPGDEDLIFYDIWQEPEKGASEALKVIQDGLAILPSSLENSLLDTTLLNPKWQKNAVRDLAAVLNKAGYDLVLIDCPPSLGTATISAIAAANRIIIPVSADAFSIKGLELTMNEVDSICDAFGLETPLINILFTRFDKRIRISTEVSNKLEADWPEKMLPVKIRTSSEFLKALQKKETVFAHNRTSTAREDYDHLARYLFKVGPEIKTEQEADPTETEEADG